jgi:CheY-like chemotaxis protein
MQASKKEEVIILLADDDVEDRAMARKALDKHRLANDLYCVADGEELLDFLNHRGAYAAPGSSPMPGLILLDLNMPKMDGREALAAIKVDPLLRRIPVVVMTTSQAETDVVRSYDLGANSFITKPITFAALADVMMELGQYWFSLVRLADRPSGA